MGGKAVVAAHIPPPLSQIHPATLLARYSVRKAYEALSDVVFIPFTNDEEAKTAEAAVTSAQVSDASAAERRRER